eukprot:m.340066 g.340066  ORF g.340066 m.340066 type:complete len:418 (+) comp19109_c0_seq1:192-1445(+)
MPFTGIVEEMGSILSCNHEAGLKLWDGSIGTGVVLTIKCSVVLEHCSIGCSIAVNGTCLTVTSFNDSSFCVNVSPETLRRTNLGELSENDLVNLERAMLSNGRNSGHMVQGHVDGTGIIFEKKPDGEALWIDFVVPASLLRFIVEKGYIAIDGTSLTVCTVNHEESKFSVMLVAHTQKCVTLPRKAAGSKVNLEVDVTAKYVNASVSARLEALEKAVFGDQKEKVELGHKVEESSSDQGEITAIRAQIDVKNKHGAGLKIRLPTKDKSKKFIVGIVRTAWHTEFVDMLVDKCVAELVEGGVLKQNIHMTTVSGSFELPFACKQLIGAMGAHVVIPIGVLLKGGTNHMEIIATSVTSALMDLQMKQNVPVIFGVLTVFSLAQAKERAESDLAGSWAQAALSQAMFLTHRASDLYSCPH